MKKIILSIAFASIFLAGNAQDNKKEKGQQQGKPTTEQELKQFSDLNLTSKQTEKLKALFEERNSKRSTTEKKQDNSGQKESRSEKSADFQKEHQEFDAKVKSILTAEQYKQWQSSKQKGKPEGKGESGQRGQRKEVSN